MCGICGWLTTGDDRVDPEAVRAMSDVLRHRGPEGSGEARIEGANVHGWLGHRRLKILDLTDAAEQPMWSDDGQIALTYNGEVYNFRELRRELEAAGARIRSTGDTEVVLRAYERWGEDCIRRLDGMFALAIWDARRDQLLLARDRTGKKPLYYAPLSDGIAFGSEPKAVLACPAVRREPDLSRLAEYLVFGYVPNPATFLEGIRQVPPASILHFDADGVHEPEPYWDARPAEVRRQPAEDVAADVRTLLGRATRARLVSDVPLGALLSGGIDSSIVVGLMSEASEQPVHTFSIGFADDVSFDEREHARLVARHFGTHHREFVVQVDAVGLIDRLLWHHDQPFHDSSAVPTFVVCRLAREHVTVALNGDGGDEVFGGYDRFRAAAMALRVPTPIAGLARATARHVPAGTGYYSLPRRAQRFLELADAPLEQRYQQWISVVSPAALGEVLGQPSPEVLDSMERSYARVPELAPLDRILYANFRTYLPDDLAVKMDRMSMANSLETRSPFLDTAVIERLASVPARQKVGVRRLKPLLRRAFFPMLPQSIWDRRKHGFGVPMATWFRSELGTMFEDEVLAPDARSRDLLAHGPVEAMYREHRDRLGDHGARLWTILVLERWLRTLERPLECEPPSTPEVTDAKAAVAG
jgi:asparagine synthase (glutamine-hydrolysing)